MTIEDIDIQYFVTALKNSSGYDFSEYSEKSLKRRLAKVLMDNKMELNQLVTEIKKNVSFAEKVVKEITVNTTELFRDPFIWQMLRYKVLPTLQDNKIINIWHAGCSTGQEVYSMMILLNELGMLEKARIFGTDINSDVLDIARKGIYKYRFNIGYLDNFDKVIKENPYNYEKFNDIPYSKYFEIDKVKDFMRMHPFLTEKPTYKKHDLVRDENIFFNKFDIILCRNVIIYFNYNLQNRVFNLFSNSLYQGGFLLLGMHETILGPMSASFDKKENIYIKK
ncbi:MAG TPA: CheR family methyltransferase [Bacteroidales bacterium]|nr:CheR family methyltransferase [Bacteroidales bacterium]